MHGQTVHSVDISASSGNRRPYLRADERRRQLLDATGRLFDRAGFGGITMAGLAKEANVSRQLVYDHFGDLDTLYLTFVEDRLRRYREAAPSTDGLDLDEAAAVVFRHLLTIPPRDRRIVRLLAADAGVPALARVRSGFAASELSRFPGLGHAHRRDGVARAVVWTTTSALLALADTVTDGDITDAEATRMALAVVRSTVPFADSSTGITAAVSGLTGGSAT